MDKNDFDYNNDGKISPADAKGFFAKYKWYIVGAIAVLFAVFMLSGCAASAATFAGDSGLDLVATTETNDDDKWHIGETSAVRGIMCPDRKVVEKALEAGPEAWMGVLRSSGCMAIPLPLTFTAVDMEGPRLALEDETLVVGTWMLGEGDLAQPLYAPIALNYVSDLSFEEWQQKKAEASPNGYAPEGSWPNAFFDRRPEVLFLRRGLNFGESGI